MLSRLTSLSPALSREREFFSTLLGLGRIAARRKAAVVGIDPGDQGSDVSIGNPNCASAGFFSTAMNGRLRYRSAKSRP